MEIINQYAMGGNSSTLFGCIRISSKTTLSNSSEKSPLYLPRFGSQFRFEAVTKNQHQKPAITQMIFFKHHPKPDYIFILQI